MVDWPSFINPKDLAPGDSTPHPALPAGLVLHTVESPADPFFETAFMLLDDYFGEKGEMETRNVIADRLAWKPTAPFHGYGMLYNLMLLLKDGECVGLRDHTAVVLPESGSVVVHLSHVLIVPEWRRKGLAAILRTIPVITARNCAKAVGRPEAPVTLFCEMEPIDLTIPENRIRRKSYENAGFKAIGHQTGYMQPDFRPEAEIEADPVGPKPILFDILYRRVGLEGAHSIGGAEVLDSVEKIYAMYSRGFREKDMRPCLDWLNHFRTTAAVEYILHAPTEVP